MSNGVNNGWRAWAMGAALLLAPTMGATSEPPAVAGHWEPIDATNWLLRDPVTASPVAIMSDESGWRVPLGRGGVVQGSVAANPSGLDVVKAQDVSPEFWAQPSVWNMFQRGPSAFSGFGKDAGPREWAGRPAFDRRAYALDPGWRSNDSFVPPPSPGVGSIRIEFSVHSLMLKWRALPGRVYVIESTPSLSRPFEPMQTIGSSTEQDVALELPMDSAHGFYRVAEQIY